MLQPTVICLLGPTASGKTQLAIDLVKRLPLDIISVDSAMVYRGMDIGTAKPDRKQRNIAPHRLIDIRDPAQSYSVGQFCYDAQAEIQSILKQGRIPLLVGGTMLYFSLLQRGFSEMPPANDQVREHLHGQLQDLGSQSLHHQLKALDPEAATRIHPHDQQRILRALEIYHTTGQTSSSWYNQQQWQQHPYSFLTIILAPEERSTIHQRIEQRFDIMLEQGLIQEVSDLYERGDLNVSLPALRAVGYRQVWSYLANEYDWTTMRERAVIATRQFAKRQVTWLRRWTQAHRLTSDDPQLLDKALALCQLVDHNGSVARRELTLTL